MAKPKPSGQTSKVSRETVRFHAWRILGLLLYVQGSPARNSMYMSLYRSFFPFSNILIYKRSSAGIMKAENNDAHRIRRCLMGRLDWGLWPH
ncbi:uncharacterized protein BT62DRAFT_931510 [Guyanagaster necrorhizus]|uniref:Uncharacterized protein n=1 Tax=Guyanagaster necrorhizus TaxID=856835 RepID=A0A9P7VUR2_9AGAR|nr:uncharacterized protein BT62DRAFT_931510 [Guyanagaster necrorhizus MCA 3950]KAG7446937.1 hypothetical protein BT62DRAFT_931510 [Guyanagaster necrorhizus MCA 3950]